MFCTNCGDLLDEGAVFCTKCGQRVTQAATEAVVEVKEEATEVVAQAQEGAAEVIAQVQEETAAAASVAQAGVAEVTAQVQEEAAVAASVAQEGAAEVTAQVQEEAAAAASVAQEGVAETIAQVQPVAENPTVPTEVPQPAYATQEMNTWAQTPSVELSSQKPQKQGPSKKVWIIGAVAAVLIVLVAVVAVNFQTLANSVRKLTMSPQEYYVYTEKKQLQEMTANLAENYDKSLGVYGNTANQHMKYSLDVELGELVCEAISSTLEVEDVSGLSKMGLDFLISTNENIFSGGMAARLGNTSLISVNALAEIEEGMVYLQLPELSEKYISADISAEADELEQIYDEYAGMMEMYPEGAVVEDIINRYMTIMIDSFETVTEEKAVVTVGEYEEKGTKLSATMTEAETYVMLEAILTEAKTDEALIDMLVGFATYTVAGMDEQAMRDSFVEAIDEYLANVNTYKEDVDADNHFTMSIIVDKKGELIGREFSVNAGELIISYMMPQKGDEFGYELKTGSNTSMIVIEGTGTKIASDMTGEFLIRMDSEDIGEFDVASLVIESMDMKKWEEGTLDISCRIKPDADLYSELGIGAAGVLLAGYELLYEAETEENQAVVTTTLVNGDELIFSFIVTTQIGEAGSLTAPTDSILMETDEDLLEWIATMDFDKFMENISQSGMPAELVAVIQSLVDELKPLTEYYDL